MAGGIAMGVIGLWAQKNTSIVSWGRKKAMEEKEN
jgi:singapore isolate B (sub-type 7) whole genome shotgun sequence assembly, scaffold_20